VRAVTRVSALIGPDQFAYLLRHCRNTGDGGAHRRRSAELMRDEPQRGRVKRTEEVEFLVVPAAPAPGSTHEIGSNIAT
jgi:hypothetical protein